MSKPTVGCSVPDRWFTGFRAGDYNSPDSKMRKQEKLAYTRAKEWGRYGSIPKPPLLPLSRRTPGFSPDSHDLAHPLVEKGGEKKIKGPDRSIGGQMSMTNRVLVELQEKKISVDNFKIRSSKRGKKKEK